MSIRKMRSFRLPISARVRLYNLHLRTGKTQTELLIEGINLLWEKYGKETACHERLDHTTDGDPVNGIAF